MSRDMEGGGSDSGVDQHTCEPADAIGPAKSIGRLDQPAVATFQLLAASPGATTRWCVRSCAVGPAVRVFVLLLRRFQNLERAHQRVIYAHHGAGVVKFTAVVGCGEQCDQLPLRKELVAVLDDLVRTADEVHVVLVQKFANNLAAECERDTAVVFAPPARVLVWV